jgi:hypothetical protein
MALVARPRWGNVGAGAAVALICAGILVSMARLGRTSPLVVLAGAGVIVGVAVALGRALKCRACGIVADEGVVSVSKSAVEALRSAFAKQDSDEIARLLAAAASPPYVPVRWALCRSCRQAARLSAKGAGVVDLDIAGPIVGALEERRREVGS